MAFIEIHWCECHQEILKKLEKIMTTVNDLDAVLESVDTKTGKVLTEVEGLRADFDKLFSEIGNTQISASADALLASITSRLDAIDALNADAPAEAPATTPTEGEPTV